MLMWINNIAPILNFIKTTALKKKKKPNIFKGIQSSK